MRATYETWRRQNGLASWTFSVPMQPNEDATEVLSRCVSCAAAGLDGFARIHDVDVATAEHGEESTSIPGASIDARGWGLVFNRPEHIVEVGLGLDLLITLGPGEGKTAIEQAGFLELKIDEHTVEDRTVGLRLSIDIDIYSPRTWGRHRDNRTLADLNAPRLSRFLEMLRRDLHGICDAIDAEDYPGLVDGTGFVSPKGRY